jgi:hypothetical protein
MSTIETLKNSQIPDEKDITITTQYTFCKLPIRTITFPIVKTESNNLKSCKKLNVTTDCVDTDSVYGNKKKKITRNPEHVANVRNFLREYYDIMQGQTDDSNDDTESNGETFDEFLDRYALTTVKNRMVGSARSEALRIENKDVNKVITELENSANAGKTDVTSVAKLQALLAKMKAGLSEEELAMLEEEIA